MNGKRLPISPRLFAMHCPLFFVQENQMSNWVSSSLGSKIRCWFSTSLCWTINICYIRSIWDRSPQNIEVCLHFRFNHSWIYWKPITVLTRKKHGDVEFGHKAALSLFLHQWRIIVLLLLNLLLNNLSSTKTIAAVTKTLHSSANLRHRCCCWSAGNSARARVRGSTVWRLWAPPVMKRQ
jgi:hypothetical protein